MNGPIIIVDRELGDLFKAFNNDIDRAVDFLKQLRLDHCWQLAGSTKLDDDRAMILVSRSYIRKMRLFTYVPKYVIIVPFEWLMLFTSESANVRFYIACEDYEESRKHIRSALNLLAFL